MDCSAIELKVISCKDLRAFNFFQKLAIYADVSVFNDELKKEQQQQEVLQQRQKTPVDRDGDNNPEWNHTMSFDLKAMADVDDQWDHWFIRFDMRNDGAVLGKSLGKVQVPLQELIKEFNGAVRFMSYQVKNTDGKSNGVLDFSYQVIGKNTFNDVDPTSDEAHVQQPLYPTLEVVESLSRDMLYPSLYEISSPLPTIPIPSPMLDAQFYLPPPPPPPHHHHHQHRHRPFHAFAPVHPRTIQPPRMFWHPSEVTNHGCNFCGSPAGLGQGGMMDHKSPW